MNKLVSAHREKSSVSYSPIGFGKQKTPYSRRLVKSQNTFKKSAQITGTYTLKKTNIFSETFLGQLASTKAFITGRSLQMPELNMNSKSV